MTSSPALSRRLRDIEIHCKDGLVMASSQVLALNSIVFEKLLFSVIPMEESKTNIVHLDDVLMADMDLLLKFYEFRVESVADYFGQLETGSVMSLISIAHRYEFTGALGVLCDRLTKVIPVPTSAELQFADTLLLESVLKSWSRNCSSLSFYQSFVEGLADFPLSKPTLLIFSAANRDYTERMMCPTRCMH